MSVPANCGPLPHFRAPWVCEHCGGALGPYTDEQEARVRERLAQIERARDEHQRGQK